MHFFARSIRGRLTLTASIGLIISSVLIILDLPIPGLILGVTCLSFLLGLQAESLHRTRSALLRAESKKTSEHAEIRILIERVIQIMEGNEKQSREAHKRHAEEHRSILSSAVDLSGMLSKVSIDLKDLSSKHQRVEETLGSLSDLQHVLLEGRERTQRFNDWERQLPSSLQAKFPESSADAINESLSNKEYSNILHIGGLQAATWTYDLVLSVGHSTETITFAFSEQNDLSEFRNYVALRPNTRNINLVLLEDAPPAAASIGGTLATEVDLLIVDFGCSDDPAELISRIPKLFWHWLRRETDVVVIDSARLKPVLAAQVLLEGREGDLLASVMSGNDSYLRIKRGLK